MKQHIKEISLILIAIILLIYFYKFILNESYNHQNSLITNSIDDSKLKEKNNFEIEKIRIEAERVIKEMEQNFIKNISISLSKIKELEAERLPIKNSLEPDVKKRIESLKIKHKIRNVIAYVFFGRREFMKILFRYLDSNLKENGGILDKIVLSEHLLGSEKEQNKKYLTEYLANHKTGYELIGQIGDHQFTQLYTILHDDDLVFKIDDDTVFVANGTFEKMVEDYLKNDRFITSANVVNHHTFSGIHRNMNILIPFYEFENNTWIEGSKEQLLYLKGVVQKNNETSTFEKCTSNRLLNWRTKPQCAAIAHENLLYHAYKTKFNLSLYDFNIFDLYSFKYEAFRINFILFRGNVVNKMNIKYKNVESDEEIITKHLPTDNNRHTFAIGSAVVSHFAYSTDGNYQYLSKTNILSKYDKLSIDYFKN